MTSRSKTTKSSPANNKAVQNSTSGLLSDNGEESGAEVFKVKKPNRQKKPPPALVKPTANQPIRTTTKSENVTVRYEEETRVK